MNETALNTVSFSRLNSFDEVDNCLRGWEKRYIEKNEDMIGNCWSEWGLAYHDTIAKYLGQEIIPWQFKDILLEKIQECPYSFPKFMDSNKTLNQILDNIDTFHFFKDYEVLEFEEKHEFDFDGFTYIAIPDFVGINEYGEFVIADHKISKVWTKKDIPKKKRQLYTYSIPIELKYGRLPDKFAINHFKDGIIVDFDFNQDEYQEAKDWNKRQIDRILNTGEFIPRCETVKDRQKDFFACNLCSYRHNCEYSPRFVTI